MTLDSRLSGRLGDLRGRRVCVCVKGNASLIENDVCERVSNAAVEAEAPFHLGATATRCSPLPLPLSSSRLIVLFRNVFA
jgi:hypothetical protein